MNFNKVWVKNNGIDWNKIGKIVAYTIPVLLILFLFHSNRSLFLDGLNLARNIAESSFIELAQPLKYQQSAPLLFLLLSKVSTLIFGVSEYTLKLLPLISGLACLFFFGDLLKRILNTKYVLLAVFWLGTHSIYIRYTTEFKQYITDTFVCVFLIWLALKLDKLTNKNVLAIALFGAAAIWLSMPSVFVLFGLICYYAHLQFSSKRSLYPVVALAVWFFLNFALEYILILSPAINSDHMQNFHDRYFLQGPFWKMSSLQHDLDLLVSMVRMGVGKSGLAIAMAILLSSICIYDFIKNRKRIGLLLVLPIAAVLGASLLGKYSLIERLMLFTLPLHLTLIMLGLQLVIKKMSTQHTILKYLSIGIVCLSLAAGYMQIQGIKYVFDPLEIEDNRLSLIHINQHEKHSNAIICTQHAYPAYSYYTQHDSNLKSVNIGDATAAKYGDSIPELAINKSNADKEDVWILMGHMLESEITTLISELDKVGTIKNSYRTNRSAAILFSTQ